MTPTEFRKLGEQILNINEFTQQVDLMKHYAPEEWQERIGDANEKIMQGIFELSLIYGNIFLKEQKQGS